MIVTVHDNLAALNKILPEYQRVSRKTSIEVLTKKGRDLAIRMGQELRKLTPTKGAITSTRLAAMEAGGGVKVRPSIVQAIIKRETVKRGGFVRLSDKAKHIADDRGVAGIRFRSQDPNWFDEEGVTKNAKGQSLWSLIVKRELAARESGRGYTAFAARMGIHRIIAGQVLRHMGRNRQVIGDAKLLATQSEGSLTMTWGGTAPGGQPIGSGVSLSKPPQQAAIAVAIRGMLADIEPYVARKYAESMQGAVGKAIDITPFTKRL